MLLLTVDYSKTPKRLIEDGEYDKVIVEKGLILDDFLTRNSPPEDRSDIEKVGLIVVRKEWEGVSKGIGELLEESANDFLQPANLFEFLHFGAQHQFAYKDYPVFFFGFGHPDGAHDNALLINNGKSRAIVFSSPVRKISGVHRIAFIRNS